MRTFECIAKSGKNGKEIVVAEGNEHLKMSI